MPDAYPRYVIPPYILRRIVDRGSLQQQRCAQNTLSHVQTLMAHVPGRPAAPHVTTPGLLERDIYDAGQTQDLPGTQVRFEGQPSNGDVAVDEAYDYLGITHDFFWKIIGEGLLAKGIHGKGLRSMSQPGTAYDDPVLGKDPQPAHMKDFVHTQQDNGGVHINSGIPNHAFYLAASALGGFAWEKAGYAWYDAVCDQSLAKDADFSAFARLTIRHGEKRSGKEAAEAITQAWERVGVVL